ncbi:MAG: hypothetical protein ABR880_11355 [Candidatus Sulfotelmatobacter sp.]|jgi:hypothetical protein
MKQATRLLVNACFAAAMSSTILAQDVTNPSPEPSSSDLVGFQMIAWSALQKLQPLDQLGLESARSKSPGSQPDRAVSPSGQQLPALPPCPETAKKDKPQANK